jgi:hydrogenase maturation protease
LKTLLYGIGNDARQDDGLGIQCAERIESWCRVEGVRGVDIEAGVQLSVEDAATIAAYDRVVFLDASVGGSVDFNFDRIAPEAESSISSHSLSPSDVLGVCQALYGRSPETYVLHIRGYGFELGEPMTAEAEGNLRKAVIGLKTFLAGNAG